MTLWRRAPREVYRVYGEEEYLAEDGPTVEEFAATVAGDGEEGKPATIYGSRSNRLLALGLLAGVIVGAVALVVFHVSHRSPAIPRSGALRSVAPAHVAKHPSVAHPSSSRTHASPELVLQHSDGALVRAPASMYRQAHTLPHTERRTEPTPLIARVFPRQPRPSTSELSSPPATASPVVGEFDFER